LADRIPTFRESTIYQCTAHDWFAGRGVGQRRWMDDMVEALKKPTEKRMIRDLTDLPDKKKEKKDHDDYDKDKDYDYDKSEEEQV
jgi:hypothetical protein